MFKPLFSIMLIVLAALGYFMGIRPMSVSLDALRADRDAKRVTLTQGQEIEKVLKDLQEKSDSITQEEKDSLNMLLPEKVDLVERALGLQTLIAKRQLVLTGPVDGKEQVAPNDQNKNSYRSFVISLNIIGTYESFKNLLADLSKSKVINDVDGLTLTPLEKGLFSFSLKIKTYWLPSGKISVKTP